MALVQGVSEVNQILVFPLSLILHMLYQLWQVILPQIGTALGGGVVVSACMIDRTGRYGDYLMVPAMAAVESVSPPPEIAMAMHCI